MLKHAAALEAKHALEVEEEQLRRWREMLQLDTEIAATDAVSF